MPACSYCCLSVACIACVVVRVAKVVVSMVLASFVFLSLLWLCCVFTITDITCGVDLITVVCLVVSGVHVVDVVIIVDDIDVVDEDHDVGVEVCVDVVATAVVVDDVGDTNMLCVIVVVLRAGLNVAAEGPRAAEPCTT